MSQILTLLLSASRAGETAEPVPAGPGSLRNIRVLRKALSIGWISRQAFPVWWETTKVSLKDAYRIRRIYRRLAKLRGRVQLRRLTVFIRHENVVRLLKFLGYHQEE